MREPRPVPTPSSELYDYRSLVKFFRKISNIRHSLTPNRSHTLDYAHGIWVKLAGPVLEVCLWCRYRLAQDTPCGAYRGLNSARSKGRAFFLCIRRCKGFSMAIPGIPSTKGRRPRIQKVSIRSAAHNLAGPEQPYPVYQFSRRIFLERPGHNPFDDAATPVPGTGFGTGFDGGFG